MDANIEVISGFRDTATMTESSGTLFCIVMSLDSASV